MGTFKDKDTIRQETWQRLTDQKAARFPFPVKGRIPNFTGSNDAARKVTELKVWKEAQTIKINPDSPQKKLRELAMAAGKTLIVPTPRLKEGFLILDNVKDKAKEASSIKGASKHGSTLPVKQIPDIDLIVSGSVAVTRDGARVGKGHGYSEIEYGICRELGKVSNQTPVLTTVHPLQIVEEISVDEYDVPIDIIGTPDQIIRTQSEFNPPQGILWSKISDEMLQEMPVLQELST